MTWLWFLLLIVQAMAFTWVSRARNSGSLTYHGIAATISNTVYFVANLFMIQKLANANMPTSELMFICAATVVGQTLGSLLMHWAAMKWLEKGNRSTK